MAQVRPGAVTRSGAIRVISALLIICVLCSCGLQRSQAYKQAFDAPDRKVLVVLAADRMVSPGGATSAVEGAGYGAIQSVGALFSIIYIPFIPVILYDNAKAGSDMRKVMDANPDWQQKLKDWMVQRKLEESFRSELQSQFPLEPHAHPTGFTSSEAARDYFAKEKPRNLTVVAITEIGVSMDITRKRGCPDCVAFRFLARLHLIDAESGEVLLNDYHSGGRDRDGLPLPDYITDDFAKLDAAITDSMIGAAWSAAANFRMYR